MKLEYIHALLTLYQTGNMTRASEQLFISQQGLSKQIKVLEKSLGASLFIRTINGTRPTALCQKLYPAFKKIDEGYAEIIRACSHEYPQKGMHFVVAQGLARYIDYTSINKVIRENYTGPFVLEECPAEACIEKLQSAEADIAFLTEPQQYSKMKCLPFMQLHGYVAMEKGHPLASHPDPLPAADLDGQSIVGPAKGSTINARLDHYFHEAGVRPNYVAFIADNLSFLDSLHSSDLIVPVLDALIPRISNDDITFKYVTDPPFTVQVNCCYLEDTPRTGLAKTLAGRICRETGQTPDIS